MCRDRCGAEHGLGARGLSAAVPWPCQQVDEVTGLAEDLGAMPEARSDRLAALLEVRRRTEEERRAALAAARLCEAQAEAEEQAAAAAQDEVEERIRTLAQTLARRLDGGRASAGEAALARRFGDRLAGEAARCRGELTRATALCVQAARRAEAAAARLAEAHAATRAVEELRARLEAEGRLRRERRREAELDDLAQRRVRRPRAP
jgi:chromosome segregation protein